MIAFLGLSVGLFLTMVLLPALVRLSGLLDLIDHPGYRKVHREPIPRVGGIAVFLGFLLPLLIWGPLDGLAPYFLGGGAVLVFFGVVDDRYSINYRWKFAGQSLAVLVVMVGGLHFERLPFFGLDPVPLWIDYPVTFLFLLGVTNALNLTDGLDGLAAGSAIMSLAGIAILAYAAPEGLLVYLGSAALIGSILGFLRFNTHPAVVFLGDAGSQFLGFTLGSMSILLVKDVNSALNSILPIFLIGLPFLDTISVIVLRLYHNISPFRADNRHIQHRLLALGFKHDQTVVVIYSLQAGMVTLGLLTRYQGDSLVAVLLLGYSILVYGLLFACESSGWRFHARQKTMPNDPAIEAMYGVRRSLVLRRRKRLSELSAIYVSVSVGVFLLLGALLVGEPSRDISAISLGLAGLMMFAHVFLNPWTRLFTRISIYVVCLFLVYLIIPITQTNFVLDWSINIYLIVLGCVLALAIGLTRRENFQMTPLDVLVLFFIVAVANLDLEILPEYHARAFVLRVVVLLYACEFILNKDRISFRWLRISGFISLVILGVEGLT